MTLPKRAGLLYIARTKCESRTETTTDEEGKKWDHYYFDEEFTTYLRRDNDEYPVPLATTTARPLQITYHDGSILILDHEGILRLEDNQRTPLTANSLINLEGRLLALSTKHGLFDAKTGEQQITPEQMKEQAQREGLCYIEDACLHEGKIVILGGHEKKERYGYTIDYFTLSRSRNKKKEWVLNHECVHPLTSAVAKPMCGSDATPDHHGIVCSINGYLYSRNPWCGPVTVQKTPKGIILSEIRASDCVIGITYDESVRTLYLQSTGNRYSAPIETGKIPKKLKRKEHITHWKEAEPHSKKMRNQISLAPREYNYNFASTGVLCRVTPEQARTILKRYAKETDTSPAPT